MPRAPVTESMGRPGLSPKVQESFQQVIDALEQALAEIEQAIEQLSQVRAMHPSSKICLVFWPCPGLA